MPRLCKPASAIHTLPEPEFSVESKKALYRKGRGRRKRFPAAKPRQKGIRIKLIVSCNVIASGRKSLESSKTVLEESVSALAISRHNSIKSSPPFSHWQPRHCWLQATVSAVLNCGLISVQLNRFVRNSWLLFGKIALITFFQGQKRFVLTASLVCIYVPKNAFNLS